MEQHPFLDGVGQTIGNAVFEADLLAAGIFGELSYCRAALIDRIQDPRAKANPFLLAMIHTRLVAQDLPDRMVPTECIGPMYDSLSARASAGEAVVLLCERVVHIDDENRFATRVTMLLAASKLKPTYMLSVIVPADGLLRFPRGLGQCVIYCSNDLEVGDGETIRLQSPSLIDVKHLTFKGSALTIETNLKPRTTEEEKSTASNGTVIIAHQVDALIVTRAPRLAAGVDLLVSWSGSDTFPWHQYSKTISSAPPDVADARLALRRLILSFRSHSRGALARFVDKIEHFRMTRGDLGERLRAALLRDKVLSRNGDFYFLDPDRLGELLGTTYQDIKAMRFSTKCDSYLRGIK